jgi:hypothetical protein
MKTSEQVDKLYPAFIAFQSEVPSVLKDGNNPHFKSKYATLPAITESVRPYLAKHGLGFTQSLAYRDGVQLIFTRVMHTSGQWMEDEGYILNPTKNDPQGMASAVTYARRNTLGATCGIVTEEDDDGNKASEPAPVKKLPPVPAVKLPEPDWFNDLGEINDKGKAAAKAVAGGMTWAEISRKYTITDFARNSVNDYASTLKPKNASSILEEADAMDSDDLPFK